MIMCGKKRLGTEELRVADMLHHRPGNAQPVVGACAAPDFIQDQQRVGGGVAQNICNLIHLHHKRTLPAGKIIRRSHTCENAVHDTDLRGYRRHIAAKLRHQNDQRRLAHIGGFSRHVRSRNDRDAVIAVVEVRVIVNKHIVVDHLLDHRMTSALDVNDAVLVDFRTAVIILIRDKCERHEYIQTGNRLGGPLDAHNLRSDRTPHLTEEIVL